MIFSRSPLCLNSSFIKFKANSRVIIRHGHNPFFSWCYLTPGQRLWRKYVYPKRYNGKISPRVSPVNSGLSSCRVSTASGTGRSESYSPYTYTVTNMKARMNSQDYTIKKTVGTPKKAELHSFIPFEDEGPKRRNTSPPKSFDDNVFVCSNLDSNQKILSDQKDQPRIDNSQNQSQYQKPTHLSRTFLVQGKCADASKNLIKKDTMIINPYRPDLRTIIHFKNKNVEVIEPSSNSDQINLANEHIMQLRKNLSNKPSRINFVKFDSSKVYFNQPFGPGMDSLILKRVESICLETPFFRYWVPIEEEYQISELFPGNDEITLICYEEKNDTIVPKVPIKRNTLIEESVIPSKSILDIINSIDTSTVIIQKDLYITNRIIQSIKDDEKNNDKKKMDTRGFLENLNQDLILHFTVKRVGNSSIHELNSNMEGRNLLYLPKEFSCSPESFLELLKGLIKLNIDGFHLLKTNSDNGSAEFFFSLLGKADLKGTSPGDIIRRALGILEKEKFYQRKIREEQKEEKPKKNSVKGEITDKIFEKEKRGMPKERDLCNYPLEISGDMILGSSHILLSSCAQPDRKQSQMPFEFNYPRSTSYEEPEVNCTVSDDTDQKYLSFSGDYSHAFNNVEHHFLCNDGPKVYTRDGVKHTKQYSSNKYNNPKVPNRENVILKKYHPSSKFHHTNNIKQDDSFLESKNYEKESALNTNLTNHDETNFKNKFHNLNNTENYVKYFNSLKEQNSSYTQNINNGTIRPRDINSFDFPSDAAMLGNDNHITNSNDIEFVSHRDINFNNIYTNSNETKRKVQVHDFIKAKYCINESCKTHYIRPREIRQVYYESNDIDWSIEYSAGQDEFGNAKADVQKCVNEKEDQNENYFNNKPEINTNVNQKDNFRKITPWIDNSNDTQKMNVSETGRIDIPENSYQRHSNNMIDVSLETKRNINSCNSMDIKINDSPSKIDQNFNFSNLFDVKNILKNKKSFEVKYFNNNNYKQTSSRNIFEINSLQRTENVIKNYKDHTFINTKYINYNNSGDKNSESNINREKSFIKAYDNSEFLKRSTKVYNFIKDYYDDVTKIANSEGLNNIEIDSVSTFADLNAVRDLTENNITKENCNPMSTVTDSTKDVNLSEKEDNSNGVEEINNSTAAKCNNIQATNTCHDSNYIVENNFMKTRNEDVPNLVNQNGPERISEERISSENTFGYSSDVGNIKDIYSMQEKSDNNYIATDSENMIRKLSHKSTSDSLNDIEKNGKNEEEKTQYIDSEINKTENSIPEPSNTNCENTKFTNKSFTESSDKIKKAYGCIPCIEDNLASSECASLVDKSVMCLMSSQGKKGKGEEVKIEKLNTSGSNIIKDAENSDHIKKTSINVTKKNDFTDINVSEKEVFTDPRIPVSFSTESTFQIIGSNSSIQNEIQAFETATGALISSIAETKNNKSLFNVNLTSSPKIGDQTITDSPKFPKKSHKKSVSKAYTYRKKLNMKQVLKNGKTFKKQNVGQSRSLKFIKGKPFKAKNKKTIGTFKSFVENIKKNQESDINSTNDKIKDELQTNIQNDLSINMTELDAKNQKSINNYVHLLEGSGKKHHKISNSTNQKKRKKVALIEHKSLSKRDKIILREIMKANRNKKKPIKPTKSKEELKSLYKGLKYEKRKVTNNMESLAKSTPQNSLMKGTKTNDSKPNAGNQERKAAETPSKLNQVPKRETKSSSTSNLRHRSPEGNKAINKLSTDTLKEIKTTPLPKEKMSPAKTSTSFKSDGKQLGTSEKIEKTKLSENKTEADAKQIERSFSGHKKEQKIATIETLKNVDNENYKEVFKKKLLSKVESKIESNSQINFRVGNKKMSPKSGDDPKQKLTSPESKVKSDKMTKNLKGPTYQNPYSPKVKASNPPIKNAKSAFKPLSEGIPIKEYFPQIIKVSKPLKNKAPLSKMGSKTTSKQQVIKVKNQDDKQITSKNKLDASKSNINVSKNIIKPVDTNKIEKIKVEKTILDGKPEHMSFLPLKPEPSASEKAVKVEKKEETTFTATNISNIDPKTKVEIPVYVQTPKEEKISAPPKPKSTIKEGAFPKLLVDLDKMTKEIKPKFSYKTSRICSIPLDKIKNFPIWNPKKNKVIEQPSTVIKVCPSKDSKLSKELSRIPPVTKILNVTLHKATKDQLKTWWQVMTNKLGDKGFKNLYKGEMTSGSQFHNLIQDQLLWGGGGAIPSSLSFKSLQNVLKEVKDLCVINSHVVHSTLAYRGVVDCVAKYKKKPVVIEWKRMDNKENLEEKALESAFQQISAYIGAMNYDSNYDFQVKGGLLVLAYSDGTGADCFDLNEKTCENYWKQWLDRLQRYHIHVLNKNK